eukprot:CAMPEP_0172578968 /NCGR_PEP_ID=MMETSP1067-20121228/138989_1 /TAXON_ID=265564 ORGANISM="Thalassiosira punctigera, Strain Tpunct2005C2" /NCGR_SAMPLE_ID=MMETSP1067 /ASSEMBLY_ACC=CAM_ASM_000444 /LENGTH=240 /DNA_ID=CAMNT_0013371675 /DNA_START=884 /DNA_END=1607 /DNA_ORIENTATION=-
MMKLAVLATLVGSVAAFAPSPIAQSCKTALNADFSKELGAQIPLGFFDPLGMVADADQEEFDRLRWVELKHGRVAMLAVTGYLVTYAGVRFPGAEDIPSGFAALDAIPGMVWAQMIATWTMMEAANQDQYAAPWGTNQNALGDSPAEFKGDFRNGALDFGWDKLSDDAKMRKRAIEQPAEFKGDFRNGALDFGWDKLSDDAKMRKRAIELNNGRAAQMGILGLMVHEKLGNVDNLLPPHF